MLPKDIFLNPQVRVPTTGRESGDLYCGNLGLLAENSDQAAPGKNTATSWALGMVLKNIFKGFRIKLCYGASESWCHTCPWE